MGNLKFTFVVCFCLFSLCIFVSAKGGKKDDKKEKIPRNSPREITSCMGQPVDLKAQVESSAQECIDTYIQELEEKVDANTSGKKAKNQEKLAKKKEKLTKKLKQKCMPECEWKAFDLIPDVNDTTIYPANDISDEFLKSFPQNAQEALKTGMQACYNTTSPMAPKEDEDDLKQKMCSTNVKLMKCFSKTIRKTCKGKSGSAPSTSTAAPKSGSGEVEEMSTNPPSEISNDDNDDDDDEEADDDDEDEDEESSSDSPVTVRPSNSTSTTPKSS